MTEDGNVYSESVIIRANLHQLQNYVPPKGIDITYEPVDPKISSNEKQDYTATLIGSDILPEESVTPQQITKVLFDWRTIVSDRVRIQRKKPLKHTIDTFIEREPIQLNDQLRSRIEPLLEENISIRDGKKWGRVFSGEVT